MRFLIDNAWSSSVAFILFRRSTARRASQQVRLLLANLPTIQDDLARGAVVTLDGSRLRIRKLPILGGP